MNKSYGPKHIQTPANLWLRLGLYLTIYHKHVKILLHVKDDR